MTCPGSSVGGSRLDHGARPCAPLENRLRGLMRGLGHLGWLNAGLDHHVDRSPGHDEMLHTVSADEKELPSPIDIGLVHHLQTLRWTGAEKVAGEGTLQRTAWRSCAEIAAQQQCPDHEKGSDEHYEKQPGQDFHNELTRAHTTATHSAGIRRPRLYSAVRAPPPRPAIPFAPPEGRSAKV